MDPVELPRYVIFQRDNGYNLRLTKMPNGQDYLQFNTTDRNKSVSHEVFPAPGHKDSVMIKSLDNDKFWRKESSWDWIWASESRTPKVGDTECFFKVVQVDAETVALECLANSSFLNYGTGGSGWDWDCLRAKPGSPLAANTHLRVTSGLSERRVSDVKYDMDEMKASKSPPETLGRNTGINDTTKTKDIEVVVRFTVQSEYSWRTVTTFDTGLNMTVTAGIPDFDSGTVDEELSYQVTNGKMYTKPTKFSKTYTAKDVAPGETVEVKFVGSRAEAKVPFTYKYVDIRVDQFEFPPASGKDGVFKGVQVLHIKPVEKRGV